MPILVGLPSSEARLVPYGDLPGQIHPLEDRRVGQRIFECRHPGPAWPRDLQSQPGVEQIRLVVDEHRADPDDRRLRPDRMPRSAASSSNSSPYLGTGGSSDLAPAVSDQPRVDLELAAQCDEQPGSLGPDSLGLRRHAPHQNVVRPGERLGSPPNASEPGGTS